MKPAPPLSPSRRVSSAPFRRRAATFGPLTLERSRPRGSVTWYGAAPKNGSGCASNHAPHLTTYGRAAPDHYGGGYYDHGSNAQETTPRRCFMQGARGAPTSHLE